MLDMNIIGPALLPSNNRPASRSDAPVRDTPAPNFSARSISARSISAPSISAPSISAPSAPLHDTRPASSLTPASAGKDRESGGEHDKPTPIATPAPLHLSSSLTTYRDHESGRLVVRVVDENNGDILIEFPPERQELRFPAQPPLDSGKSTTSFEV